MRFGPTVAWTLVLAGLCWNSARAQLSLVEIQAAPLTTDYYEALTHHGLGINWLDYDNDDWPDLFMVNGKGLPPHLYRNNRDGTFTNRDDLLPALPDVEMARSAFGDYDRDGDVDLYIWTDHPTVTLQQTNPEDGPLNLLLKNLWMETGEVPGQPLFAEVAQQAGVADSAATPLGAEPGMRAKTGFWFDYDRDGDLDLFVAHWVPQSGGRPANQDRLFRNEGDGTFSDVSISSGVVDSSDTTTWRPALASIGAHLDGDLWPDIYVVNTVDPMPYHGDQIFRNNGDGTFSEVTALSPGVGDDCEAGMGIDAGDLDLDGGWDLYISDLRNTALDALPLGNPFYLSNGDGTFQDNSAPAAGLVGDNSWGVSCFDFDQDGYEDIFLATMDNAAIGASFVYRNRKDGTFTKMPGIGLNLDARGCATADFDRDGDLDIAQIMQRNTVRLIRNDSAGIGNWIQLKLKGVQSSRDAIGTLVELEIGGVVQRRQVKGGSSAHSQDDLVVHFGVGAAAVIDEIRVRWAAGTTDVLTDVPVNRLLHVVEGTTASPRAVADLSGMHLNFGSAGIGAAADLGTALTNEGTQTLTVSSLSTTHAAFTPIGAPAVPFDVLPNATLTLAVRFAPLAPGPAAGELQVATNDPAAPLLTVGLTGEGTAATAASPAVPGAGPALASRATPNPFRARVAVDYELPRAGAVTLSVYDAAGRRVADVVRARQEAGHFRAEWDGRSREGGTVPSGVYFYRLALDGEGHTRKLLLLR